MRLDEERGKSYWTYPPALNIKFRDDYANQTANYRPSGYRPNDTHTTIDTYRGTESLLVEALQNLTFAERVDGNYTNNGFGGNDAIVTVGDVFELDWQSNSNQSIALNCVICTAGKGEGLIEEACEKYTRSFATTQPQHDLPPSIPPRYPFAFPTLDNYFTPRNETCAMCMFSLLQPGGYYSTDFSVPFPVLQQPSTPHKRFNAQNPTGIEDSSIPNQTPRVIESMQGATDGGKPNVGLIVGVVVGVLGGAATFVALGVWLLWKKRGVREKSKKRKKTNGSCAGSLADQPRDAGTLDANDDVQNIRLQNIQPVARRPESSASDVPPPYHEAVQNATTPPDRSARYG